MDAYVSAIIVTHGRRPAILSRAIDSVLEQKYDDMELIIVNSAPSYDEKEKIDKTLSEYIESNPKIVIKYIVTETDINGSAARNIGLSQSKGSLIAFLDDDDEWLPEKLNSQVINFDETKDIVFSDYLVESEDGTSVRFSKTVGEIYEIEKDIIGENLIGSTSFPMIRRTALEKISGFDETMESNQEWDIWIRMALFELKIVRIDDILGIKHMSEFSITSDKEKRILGWERLFEKNKAVYKNNPRLHSKALCIYSRELKSKGCIFRSFLIMIRAGLERVRCIIYRPRYNKKYRSS